MTNWRRGYGAGALILAATAVTGVPGAAAPPTEPVRSGPIADAAHTVTLITGDRVELQGSRTPSVRPGPQRAGMQFQIYRDGGDTYVLPYDAMRLVTAGRVDRRLFNVTKLAELGYDDSTRKDVPLIVTGTAAKARSTTGARLTRELPAIGSVAVRESKDQATAFWSATSAGLTSAGKIWLDAKVKASLDQSVPQIGAPAAWQAGHTGQNTKVAVLDTGIDTTHADLADAVVADKDFSESESGTDDRLGHGTHVASIITGSGAASDGKYKGVAPDTKLLNGKVLNDDGGGSESGIIAGMEWAAEQGADVVNMSFGSAMPGFGTDPLEQAVNRLTASTGTLYVVAAGNNGNDEGVTSPAAADAALAVGAVDKSDELAALSARGPRFGDGAIKPDITAPGIGIVAARAAHATIGTPVGTDYLRLNGTSMATPHVAGAAAILAGQHPDWNAGRLKAALMDSAQPNAGLSIYQQGAGRVDVARATTQPVSADTASLSLGAARWPHADDQPIRRTVTYHNDGDQPVTLTLTTDVRDPKGIPAPAGMFTASVPSLTVPAHGDASADLIADTKVDGPDGLFGGALIATGGQLRVRTPVGVNREVESYDVTVSYVDWDGRPVVPGSFRFVDVDQPKAYLPADPSSTNVTRLPKGTYYFEASLSKVASENPFVFKTTEFVEPAVTANGDQTLLMDARDGVPVGFRTDHPEARLAYTAITSLRDTAWGGKDATGHVSAGVPIDPAAVYDTSVRPSRTSAPGAYHFDLEGHLARPDGRGDYTGSPYQYHLKWSQDGKVPADLNRRIRDRDLAEVPVRIAAQNPGELVTKDFAALRKAPATLIERYSPGVELAPTNLTQFNDRTAFDISYSQDSLTTRLFPAKGRQPAERWNVGPFVPGFDPRFASVRIGDAVGVSLRMYSDQFRDHAGDSAVDSASTRLLRDGTEVASSEFPGYLITRGLPSQPATYRLETEAVRSNSPFSTRQTAAWTFRSGTTGESEPLPLMAIRFAPRLDGLNRAPAGVRFAVPLAIETQAGSANGTVTSLAVDVSYDDGTTWRKAPVRGRTALLEHPDRDGFVSLRATATDSAGNKVEQTVIHAYQLHR